MRRASRSPGSAGASTRTSSSSGSIRAGIPYFWIGGPPPSGLAIEGTDFHAVVNRRIAITPIHLDLTGRRLLRRLNTWAWPSPGRGRGPGATADAARPRRGPEGPAAAAVEERIGDEKQVERR